MALFASPGRRFRRPNCAPRFGGGRNGTTLIELILALGVLVLAAAIIIPSVLSLAESNRLMRAGDDFKGLLAGLRSRALEESVAIEIVITQDGGAYKVARADGANQAWTGGAPPSSSASSPARATDMDAVRPEFDRDSVFGEHSLPEGVSFKNINAPSSGDAAPPGTIRFYPNGTATPIEFDLVDAAVTGSIRFHIRGLTGTIAAKRVFPNRENDSANAGVPAGAAP